MNSFKIISTFESDQLAESVFRLQVSERWKRTTNLPRKKKKLYRKLLTNTLTTTKPTYARLVINNQ